MYKKCFVFILGLMLGIGIFNFRPIFNSAEISIQEQLIERLKRLEPDAPKNITAIDMNLTSEIEPISEVLKTGRELQFNLVHKDFQWVRPEYRPYWHSTVSGGRWSFVPTRIHYALHRIFVIYPTASVYYDFVHNLGLAEERKNFNLCVKAPFEKVLVVIMQADVDEIVAKGNQVLIKAVPKRTGYTVLTIDAKDLEPFKPQEPMMFQLVTDDAEIDYALIYILGVEDTGNIRYNMDIKP